MSAFPYNIFFPFIRHLRLQPFVLQYSKLSFGQTSEARLYETLSVQGPYGRMRRTRYPSAIYA